MDIKVCVILGGHKGLGLVWVTKVSVPGAINDNKDLGLHPISRRCLPLCIVSLGGSGGGTTTTTPAAATLPLANTIHMASLLETRVIVNEVQEVRGCLGEIDLRNFIIADDSKEHIEFPPLSSTQEVTYLGL